MAQEAEDEDEDSDGFDADEEDEEDRTPVTHEIVLKDHTKVRCVSMLTSRPIYLSAKRVWRRHSSH